MRSRGQVVWALVVLVVFVAGGILLQQGLGPKGAAAGAPAAAPSGAWFCPHGGGPEWQVSLEVANPGPSSVQIRVTELSAKKPSPPKSFTVEPGTELLVPETPDTREGSSFIEYFGGWVAAGWVAHGGGGEIGVSAEPCLPGAGERWFLPDGATTQHEGAYVIVMNPFGSDAVFTLTLYTRHRKPITIEALTNVVLPPHRSEAFRLNATALGEPAVSTLIDVKVGRVAAASLGISELGGIRASDGLLGPPERSILPGGFDQGTSTLVVMNTGDARPDVQSTLLTKDGTQPIPSLIESSPAPASAQAYPVTTEGASTIDVRSSAPLAVARRTQGGSKDQGSTTGASAPAPAWVVLPAIGGTPARPGLVIANPGDAPATITLSLLPTGPEGAPSPVTMPIPPGRTVAGPKLLVTAKPFAAILVTATSGVVVPAAASYSLGQEGVATYAVSLGVPIPASWVPSSSS